MEGSLVTADAMQCQQQACAYIVTPEEAGLCGCRQFIPVWRERQYLRCGRVYNEEQEYSFYVSSANPDAYHEPALLQAMRGHWDAIENGSHYRRDVQHGRRRLWHLQTSAGTHHGLTAQSHFRPVRATKNRARKPPIMAAQNDPHQSHKHTFLKEMNHRTMNL
ncbi:MAG: hypothetical protein GVY36_05405 [Verrucomicrobia bacterium]|jgi:predicted transposase YbfD/YdcC|nr:hypothetical protein [Verrucomicrobiota bacterium]